MKTKVAPWHGEARKSGLHTKFKKRNIERYRVIKAIGERKDRRDQRAQQYGGYDDADTHMDA